jgi:hypothetical protein
MPELYTVTNGVVRLNPHPGQIRAWDSRARIVAMISGTQAGKALPVDTLIPTPSGFRLMGDLCVGDEVFDESGSRCRVTFATEVMAQRECYRVCFDDGAELIADADHLWWTQTYRERKNTARRVQSRPPDGRVRTTAEIADTLHDRRGASNHSIPLVEAIDFPEKELLIPPYALGAWLGDGISGAAMICTADEEIIHHIREEGEVVQAGFSQPQQGAAKTYRLSVPRSRRPRDVLGRYASDDRSFYARLKRMGLLHNKHIPSDYLMAGREQRLSLLQGLMDTDGYVAGDGRCEFTTINERLARDVLMLCRGLGIKARYAEGRAKLNGVDRGAKFRISFTTTKKVVRLRRKAERLPLSVRPDVNNRYIVDIQPVGRCDVRCIQVDSPNALYVAGEDYVVTHNTSFGPWWLWREIYDKEIGRGPGDYLAVTSSYDLFKLKMLPEIIRVFEQVLGLGRYWAGDGVIELADPQTREFRAKRSVDDMWGRIILRSANAEGGLESSTAKAAWLDEAGQDAFSVATWDAVLRRLSIHRGRVLITTTPYNTGWLKQQVYDPWTKGDKSFEVVQFDSIANPQFPVEEFEERRARMPEWKFRMFYQGQFTRPAGLILGDFDESEQLFDWAKFERMTGEKAPLPHWQRFVGWDFGGVNTASLWAVRDPQNRLWLYRETLEGRVSTAEHAAMAKVRERADLAIGGRMLSAEEAMRPASFLHAGGAASEEQTRMDFRRAGVNIIKPPLSGVEDGIDRMIRLIRQKRVFVHESLIMLRDGIATYSRVLDDDGEPTEKIKDKETFHLIDAFRYLAVAEAEGAVAGMRRLT